MIKRGVVIGIGTVLLVAGLGGIALLQTGVINPTQPILLENTSVGNQQAAPPESVQPQAQAPETATPSDTNQTTTYNDSGSQKPVETPRVGNGERRYPFDKGMEQPKPSPRNWAGTQKRHPGAIHKSQIDKYARRHEIRKVKSRSYATRSKSERRAGTASRGPLVIRLRYSPSADRDLYIARVHLGDRVKVNVQRVGAPEGRLYFTYTNGLNSKAGALVKVGVAHPYYVRAGYNPYESGYYMIEVKIYPGNRWNIRPRSFV